MPNESLDSFSRRHGLRPANPPITVWEDAPDEFRNALLQIANDCGLEPHPLREIVCKTLRKKPNPSNWTAYPNVWGEVELLVQKSEWFQVYDIVEAIWNALGTKHAQFKGNRVPARDLFEAQINEVMAEFGIGWQLHNGSVEARGEDAYEAILKDAENALATSDNASALTEMSEAIKDISRRPVADVSGAIQHSMAALECLARSATGDPKPTLGQLMKRHQDLFPKPVDEAVEKIWGYASERARHIQKGVEPSREEAMLIVGLAAVLGNYLIKKTDAD